MKNNCSSSPMQLLVVAALSFAVGVLVAVFLPDIIIIVMLTICMAVLCILLLKR